MDPDLSNGTCFYRVNVTASDDMISCGNVALQHWPCCYAGDMCLGFLDANACWDNATGNTYLGGCTDPGFNAKGCPEKTALFVDQEWVAIQHCGLNDNGNMEWGGCDTLEENSTALEVLPADLCDPYCSSTYLYVGATAIPAFAQLPSTSGGSIAWTSGFNPTSGIATVMVTATSKATTTGSGQPATTTGSGQPATTTSTPASQDVGLTTQATIGIAVGAVAGVLFIAAAMVWAYVVRKRRRKEQEREAQVREYAQQWDAISGPISMEQHQNAQSPQSWSQALTPYAAGFVVKSELPANETHFREELEGDTPAVAEVAGMQHSLSTGSSRQPDSAAGKSWFSDRVSAVSDVTCVQHPDDGNGQGGFVSP